MSDAYADLVSALKRRRVELGWSQLELDYKTGLQDGYVGKIECGERGLTPMSLPVILMALGAALEVVVVREVERLPPTPQLLSANRNAAILLEPICASRSAADLAPVAQSAPDEFVYLLARIARDARIPPVDQQSFRIGA